MELQIFALINVLAIGVFYVVFAIPARLYKKRITEATERLKDTSIDND